MPKRTPPKGIAPYNGRELELMLRGDKPMALFAAEPGMDTEDVGDAHFGPIVEEGRILKFSQVDSKTSVEERCYCLPTEEWRCKLSLLIARMCRSEAAFDVFTPNDLARLEGTLLGYSKESVEAFVAHAASLKFLNPSTD
ncbi:hemin receptor [Mesorhizobium sp. M7A.F.Ca.US.006.04.2.1]|uniref:hemin receptor n=1 Tax=unclassified Mesorhizobium TaxID=325217 RepID=UPI000FCC11CD|nr:MULTISPECIES: hemin receptor [unclassified Mesorhizobium]RUX74099.1 hemin receptor [Mesorhizobium sp. M7A.F.Ca.US.005.03.1.1]RUY17779.1 hemin receptor [Mesorhizobium sp. M7A.F.Ca.US.005.03.2.1]RUY31718.1 hemin receptor [Mesorhizobium sp. M7A.F.Ca.US.001.04.2.1]RUY37655.1 hemin receptor [Mesorhizobium sp. M7A.F.Ca.US.001.04.1.1]RVA03249.1 hemin receptor [Mesorhizobium sp. M7A.F.Ca.US.001.02.1.1]